MEDRHRAGYIANHAKFIPGGRKMKLNSAILSIITLSISIGFSSNHTTFASTILNSSTLDTATTVQGQGAEAIYKALQVTEVSTPMESPGGHPFRKIHTIKSIGGLLCRLTEDFTSNIPDVYHCTLFTHIEAEAIYNALDVAPTTLAPGCCPSTYTKSVGGLTCHRTLEEVLGSGLSYSCAFMLTEHALPHSEIISSGNSIKSNYHHN
jgi:hypothetical protein